MLSSCCQVPLIYKSLLESQTTCTINSRYIFIELYSLSRLVAGPVSKKSLISKDNEDATIFGITP